MFNLAVSFFCKASRSLSDRVKIPFANGRLNDNQIQWNTEHFHSAELLRQKLLYVSGIKTLQIKFYPTQSQINRVGDYYTDA